MDFTGVYHRTTEQMSYPLNESELIVNLKTGYDVKQVFLYYGDPFEAGILGGKETWTGIREEIFYRKRLKHQIWWTTTWCQSINGANIILNYIRMMRSGTI